MALRFGSQVWKQFDSDPFLNTPRLRLRARVQSARSYTSPRDSDPTRAQSTRGKTTDSDINNASTNGDNRAYMQADYDSLYPGLSLPVSWSPIPAPESDIDPIEVFRAAQKITGVHYTPVTNAPFTRPCTGDNKTSPGAVDKQARPSTTGMLANKSGGYISATTGVLSNKPGAVLFMDHDSDDDMSDAHGHTEDANTQIPRHKNWRRITNETVQLQYTGSAMFLPVKKPYEIPESVPGVYRRKKNEAGVRAEMLLGRHVRPKDCKKDPMAHKVTYSDQYFAVKKISREESEGVRNKRSGVVTEVDPDGLMTNVQWEDGSVEYCCTGYSNLYFLALVHIPEITGADGANAKKNWRDEAGLAPKWVIRDDGVCRFQRRSGKEDVRTLADASREVNWLHQVCVCMHVCVCVCVCV
jgi:hypothetical protein